MDIDTASDFKEEFIRLAHQLLYWGYQDSRHKFNVNTEEDDISQFIVMQIKYIIKYDTDLPKPYHRYSAHLQMPVTNTGRRGKKCQRIDITIESCDKLRTYPEFICEAKRLHSSSHYVGDYAGKEGMGCFVNEEYAKEFTYAAMIGYLQSNDSDYWAGKLEKHLQHPNQAVLNTLSPFAQCTEPIVADLPQEWTSQHNRLTLPPILLYHIFLDCS